MSVSFRPCYSLGPIKSLDALSAATATKIADLQSMAADIQNHYRLVRLTKKDGSFRDCWNPSEPLRRVQRKLIVEMFRRVSYPGYLHGSLPGRDYITNANMHTGARWCLTMDIKSFFPSISAELVNEVVWSDFFRCSDQIASLLTGLTTLGGQLPQGSLTASYIANLVLHRHEPQLVRQLSQLGFRYSRYVDDIAISMLGYPAPEVKTKAVSWTNTMLRLKGIIYFAPLRFCYFYQF